MVEPKNLGLLMQVRLPCREEEEDCGQDFDKEETFLSSQRIKVKEQDPKAIAKGGG